MSDSQEFTEVLIIGFGAIGTIYGYILSQAKNVRVTAIARSAYDIMNSQGIEIQSGKFGNHQGWKPYRIVRDTAEANDRRYDFIIGTFKVLPDLQPSASIFAPFMNGPFGPQKGHAIEDGPTIVLIQNGIGIENPLQAAYPTTPIISVVAWIGTNLIPGKAIVTHGTLERLIFGLYIGEGVSSDVIMTAEENDPFTDPANYRLLGGKKRKDEGWKRTERFKELLIEGGGDAQVVADIQAQRYSKNLWNAALSTFCSLTRTPVSALVHPDVVSDTMPVVRRTMIEVLYIARAWGYDESMLPSAAIDHSINITIANYQIGKAKDSALDFKPSMLLDIDAGRPFDLEPIVGSLIERARAKRVETPRLDLIYASLKVIQDANIRKAATTDEMKECVKAWRLRGSAIAGGGKVLNL